jgi:hypothetical protein
MGPLNQLLSLLTMIGSRSGKNNGVNRTVLPILAFLLCVGRQMDKRFSRLQTGMTKSQVIATVGKRPDGDKVDDGSETLRWDAGNHYVKLRNGRVTSYGAGDE